MSLKLIEGGKDRPHDTLLRVTHRRKLAIAFPRHWSLPPRVIVKGNLRDGLLIYPDPDQRFQRPKSLHGHYQVHAHDEGFDLTAGRQFTTGLPAGPVQVAEEERSGSTITLRAVFATVVDTERTERHKASVAHLRVKAQGELPLKRRSFADDLTALQAAIRNLNERLEDIPDARASVDEAGKVRVRIEL